MGKRALDSHANSKKHKSRLLAASSSKGFTLQSWVRSTAPSENAPSVIPPNASKNDAQISIQTFTNKD